MSRRRPLTLDQHIAIAERRVARLRRILGRKEEKASQAREERRDLTDWQVREMAFYRDALAHEERTAFELRERRREHGHTSGR
jgi:hypothetical protein